MGVPSEDTGRMLMLMDGANRLYVPRRCAHSQDATIVLISVSCQVLRQKVEEARYDDVVLVFVSVHGLLGFELVVFQVVRYRNQGFSRESFECLYCSQEVADGVLLIEGALGERHFQSFV